MARFDEYPPFVMDHQSQSARSKVLDWSVPQPQELDDSLDEKVNDLGLTSNPSILPQPKPVATQVHPRRINPPSSYRSVARSVSSSRSPSFYSASPAPTSSYASRRSAAVASPKLIYASASMPLVALVPSDAEILAELRCLLSETNLQVTSRKQIRLSLQEKFHCDLESKKALISEAISKYLQNK